VGVRSFDTDFDGKTDETNVSGKFGAQYDLTDDSMTYFTYSQGYKGPAFDVFYNMSPPNTVPLSEETSDAYEVGYKFANRDVVFNAAIFRTEIDGFQANNPELLEGVFITRLTNAGSVITQGLEVDFMWQATDNLTLSGGFASIDAEIDEFLCPVGSPNCDDDSSGDDLPFSPDLKYSLMGEYVWELNDMNIYLNASYVYTDELFVGAPGDTAEINPAALLPDYGIFNASLAFSFDDDAYRISLIGKNLGDEQFVTTFAGDGFRYQIPRDADRYFGIQLRAKF
jgi:iron complex outermembrane receptor protein